MLRVFQRTLLLAEHGWQALPKNSPNGEFFSSLLDQPAPAVRDGTGGGALGTASSSVWPSS